MNMGNKLVHECKISFGPLVLVGQSIFGQSRKNSAKGLRGGSDPS